MKKIGEVLIILLVVMLLMGGCAIIDRSQNINDHARYACRTLGYSEYETITEKWHCFGMYTIYCYNLPDESGDIIKLGTFENK